MRKTINRRVPAVWTVMGVWVLSGLFSGIKAQAQQGRDVVSADSIWQQLESEYVLSSNELNQGLTVSPLELLKGRIPGLSVYKKGSDPNGEYDYQLRGFATFQNVTPLLVVDGVMVNSERLIDPADIVSIRVLKEVTAISSYGSRGAMGVIEITTFETGELNDGAVVVDASSQTAFSKVSGFIPVMGRDQYLAAGGVDLGANTNWQNLTSHNAWSLASNITVKGRRGSTNYSLSGTFRNIEGVLLGSGFERMNGRARIQHKAVDDRVSLAMGVATARQETDFSFREAFRYANLFNPTAPVRFDNGAFYQPVLFDNYNPLSIPELNINDGQSKDLNYFAEASFKLTEQIYLSSQFAQEFNAATYGEFYHSTSFFRGLANNGLARRTFTDNKRTYFDAEGIFTTQVTPQLTLTSISGYSYQTDFHESLTVQMGNLPTDELGYYAIDLSADRVLGLSGSGFGSAFIDSEASPIEKRIAFYSRLFFSFDNFLTGMLALRREGSNKLGRNARWATFPSFSAGVDIKHFWNTGLFDDLMLRVDSGQTGMLPDEAGLSQNRYRYDFSGGGSVFQVHDGNPELGWERMKELYLGMDFRLLEGDLSGSFDIYKRTTSDLIRDVFTGFSGSSSGTQYQNVGEIETKGWELALDYKILRRQNLQWVTGINLSGYRSRLTKYHLEEFVVGNPGAPGQGSTNMLRVAVGEKLGQFWGTVFTGVVNNGFPVFKDLNNDGNLITDMGSALSENNDFTELGSAVPDLELGWSHNIRYKRFTFELLFTGAFGHSLVNVYRMFYEPVDPGAISSYNRVITDKAVDGLEVSLFSSMYVEEADYLKLNYLHASYSFSVPEGKAIRQVTAFATAENVFTLTGYTGLSPEPVVYDRGPVDNGGRPGRNTPFVMGIDRRNSYLPARSFILGLRMSF